MLFYETVGAGTLQLLKDLQEIDVFSNLRLVGGTSLALQIGHRKSVDLDFFGLVDFESLNTNELFKNFQSVELIKKSKNINVFIINGIKVDFVNYTYPWIDELLVVDTLRLAKLQDIAAMKIAAITGRGSKKDFVDLYFLLKEFSLKQILNFYKTKYNDASEYLAVKSLSYFEDAEQDLPLDMLIETPWKQVKEHIKIELVHYSIMK